MPRKDHRQASVARVTRAPGAGCLTMADLLHDLGGVAPERVRAWPPPGQATEKDLIRIQRREKRNYELVDGTLVEKIMGALNPASPWSWTVASARTWMNTT